MTRTQDWKGRSKLKIIIFGLPSMSERTKRKEGEKEKIENKRKRHQNLF